MDARPFSLFRSADQWARARHRGTALDLPGGGVLLAWEELPGAAGDAPAPLLGAGLGFDARCRLLMTVPGEGRVRRWDAGPAGPGEDLIGAASPEDAGDFQVVSPPAPALHTPRGLAVDDDDRLWVAEAGAGRVVVWDLWTRRLLRRIPVPGGPVDLARRGRAVLALLADGIAEIEDRAVRRVLPLPAMPGRATRVATAPDGSLWLLFRGTARTSWLVPPGGTPLALDGASDIEWLDADTLIVAHAPGESFTRFARAEGGLVRVGALRARGYDGLGIAVAPGGATVAYGTAAGPRLAAHARLRYDRRGVVTTYRLDSGAPATTWGRLFCDACLPEGTRVRARFLTSEEPEGPGELERTPPANAVDLHVPAPELSPPLPWEALLVTAAPRWRLLHRRETGREVPWSRPAADDAFETYEAPVDAPPGRYLWVALELTGTGGATPRVRSLRVEHPAHDLVTRLPRTFSRDPGAASFLLRYLSLADGVLTDLGGRAEQRSALLSPAGAPAEALAWLAGLLGLVLDERWPEAVRRRVIDEAPWLLRFRGTRRGLERLLALLIGRDVIILERWRLRGLGAAPVADAVVGGGRRVGGATHAHRFTVLVPALLSGEQLAMVRHAIDVHRPAHTLYDVCTLGTGMRVGHGLHVGLHSAIGRSGGWEPLAAGHGAIGRGIVERPEPGTGLGAAQVGRDARVG